MPVEHRLPIGYNIHHFIFQFMHAHPVVGARLLEETRVLHYTLQKPWMGAMVTGGADAWWNQFYGAHPEKDRSWLRRLHELEDWSFERVVGALGG
jgi:lipopolysaccharide biosynthesis glycosyltransferase